MNTTEKAKQLIAQMLGVDESEVVPEARLVEDFGSDSLDLISLEIELEREFNIDIHDERVESWHTVQDVLNTVDELASNINTSNQPL